MKQDGKYDKIVLCYIESNIAAKNLYESFGFVEIDRDEDEIIMEMCLNKQYCGDACHQEEVRQKRHSKGNEPARGRNGEGMECVSARMR